MHHLLETKEMLGWMLLEAHNTHHLQAFMAAARAALTAGGLDAFASGVQGNEPAGRRALRVSGNE